MGIGDRIRRNRSELDEAIAQGRFRDFSAVSEARFRGAQELIAEHATGRVLDVGCGHMPFRSTVLSYADEYDGLDIEPRTSGVTYVCDAQEMTPVADATYDTVLCFEVLEHVPQPDRAMAEIARVLRDGGKAIFSVPHLSRLHEEPHDYFRFTGYGLRAILSRAGLNVLMISRQGGLFSFLGHQVSTILIGLTWSIPGLRYATYQLNRVLFVYPPLWLDRRIDPAGLFAQGYLAVARKPRGEG